MKKGIGLLFILFLGSFAFGQTDDELEKYAKEHDAEFAEYTKTQDEIFEAYVKKNDEYIKKLDDEWKAYLEQKFKEFELYKKGQPDIGPKPKELPKAQTNAAVKTESVKVSEVQETPKEVENVITPIIQKSEPVDFSMSSADFNFYGSDIDVKYDTEFLKDFPDHINEKIISDKYAEMSKTNYNHLINQVLDHTSRMNMNDWGYYLLIKEISEKVATDDAGAVFLQWFLLLKSNYKARIAYKADQLYLLLPAAHNIYDVPFFSFDGLRYYLINGEAGNVYTYDKDFPEATRIFDLNIERPIHTAVKEQKRKVKFSYLGDPYEFEVSFNQNVIDFYQDFPLSDATVYFDATISAATKQSLKEGLMPVIKDRSEKDAVSILLRFVQTAFDYKTDQDQFGKEKFFFPDELFKYPYSDCEDRSVLFAYLVKELLALDVIGMGFSGHMATAVHFNEDVDGDYITHKGKKYTMCDPTYINAPIGLTMPNYVGAPAQVFELRNSHNTAYNEKRLWKIVMNKGGYRGDNKGDIATDLNGNVYLTGYFKGNLTLGRYGLNSKNDSKDMFIAKIDKKGNVVWAQSYGGDGAETGYGLKLANNGDIIVTGSFDKNFSFGYKYLKTKTIGDVLVARFSPDGKLKWANQVGIEEIGLTEAFMFMAEFKFNGTHVKNNIFKEAEHFEDFGLAINNEGSILVTGAPYSVAGLQVQQASYNSGASFSAPESILSENSRLLENNYNPAIAGLFAVIKLINASSIALPGSEAQKALDKHNPAFKKRSPHIYASIGRIQFIKNSEGIVTIRTDDQNEVAFKTLKVNNNARFKVSAFNSGNSQIDILGGVRIGKSIIWYDLNAVKLFKTGDMVMDYDIDHTKIRMHIGKDILE